MENSWSGHRRDGLEVPLQVHLGRGIPTGCGDIPGHLHPALHLLSAVAPITSKAKVGGAGGRVEPILPEQQNRPISNVTLGRGPALTEAAVLSAFSLGSAK